MRNIKMIIEYDGGRYKGWQRLTDNDKTIQGKLENVISQMLETPTEVIGSGRTDAGAHALGQVANFQAKSKMSLKEMHEYITTYLPQDIAVKELKEASNRFHSRYNVSGKKYTYHIWNHPIPSVFNRNYSYQVSKELNLTSMQMAAEKLIGSHDFAPFSSVKKSNKTTVRTIKAINIEKKSHMIEIEFVGDGFLHNMIRIIVGTLIEIGLGNEGIKYIDEIFKKGERKFAGVTVPSQGLFLDEVYYE
ncbi:tRNA pseudouridine(38-40) synthase TruA [Alkaliphilus peptidifermentans]|uniref:tRNA pseudouridine synthase A n=1 Tax=Alkaliphilus peptidifermentans DSM 18978 TaxID=1120976 RepID=A0A1G5FML2_9FIRM|nr:tRNA pseudouridine(38-40) synthase TruA [Alkaliphilus peptidifermentans]SCY40401.1 tRNA pseudouridine38-40 synthase [Alkaliphilus peptidifermentans DSM 18978]